jgi:hypothetical protein
MEGTRQSGLTVLIGGEGREHIALAVWAGIGWGTALFRHRREGAHQLQGTGCKVTVQLKIRDLSAARQLLEALHYTAPSRRQGEMIDWNHAGTMGKD